MKNKEGKKIVIRDGLNITQEDLKRMTEAINKKDKARLKPGYLFPKEKA